MNDLFTHAKPDTRIFRIETMLLSGSGYAVYHVHGEKERDNLLKLLRSTGHSSHIIETKK